MAQPETRYARSGDVSIAYQVVGDGPFDLVLVPGFVSNVELAWKIPDRAAYLNRLASFSRLILFDKRGTGMSDRVSGAPSLETRMDDVRAVMDAAGSSRAAILGVSEGGPMSLLFAATYPERISALILYASFPRVLWAPDYPIGEREEDYDRDARRETERWGSVDHMAEISAHLVPGSDEESLRATGELLRQSASPGAIAALNEMNKHLDVRHVLPAIHVPTLIVNLTEDDPFNVAACRYMADRIPGAQLVEIPGPWAHPDIRELRADRQRDGAFSPASEAVTCLGRCRSRPGVGNASVHRHRRLHLPGCGARGQALGRAIGTSPRTRAAELVYYRGQELDTAGDGFFARFDGPARAIRCARSIVDGVHELGIDIRAGLHTGECELFERKVGGIAVSIGARVAAEAFAGEVLVSNTVKDLVAGSGIEFADRGAHALKGLPGEWRLFAVDRA